MASQLELAEQLYELVEERMEYDDDIKSYISEIKDLNRWNINLEDYIYSGGEDISAFVIDVKNPTQGSIVESSLEYGETILDFIIWNLMVRDGVAADGGFSEKTSELIEVLILNGAKSSKDVYNKWLSEEEFYRVLEDDWLFAEYNKIKGYLKEMIDREEKRVANETQKAYQRLSQVKSVKYPSTYSENTRYVPAINEMISMLLSEIPHSVDVDRRRELEETLEETVNKEISEYLGDMEKYGGKRKKNKRTAKKSHRKSKKRTSRKPRKRTRKGRR